MRLGLLDQAREIFLSTQSVIIKHKIKSVPFFVTEIDRTFILSSHHRKLRFEGEIYSYIKKLSQTVFYLIKNTCIWYKGFFEDPNLSSGFVRWITQEIEDYCSIFRRHVFQNQNFQITIDCLRVAAENCLLVCQTLFQQIVLIFLSRIFVVFSAAPSGIRLPLHHRAIF